MARCIIIAPLYQGEEKEQLTPDKDDLLLCADGGYAAAVRFGLKPHLVIGDLDSMPACEVVDTPLIQLPIHKDDTDLLVCIREGRKHGYRSFLIAGAIGGRLDHTIAAIQCLADCARRGEEAWMLNTANRITAIIPGLYHYKRMDGWKLSLLAYSEKVCGVSLSGTEWELCNAELSSCYPLGISNEWVEDEAVLSFSSGTLLICFSRDAM